MDRHFQIVRAEEEIIHLNIEIHQVITHLHDEEKFLRAHEDSVQPVDSALAHQLCHYCLQCTQFNALHRKHFLKLAVMPGFTGNLETGRAIDKTLLATVKRVAVVTPRANVVDADNGLRRHLEEKADEEEENEQDDEQGARDDEDEDEYVRAQLNIITALQD